MATTNDYLAPVARTIALLPEPAALFGVPGTPTPFKVVIAFLHIAKRCGYPPSERYHTWEEYISYISHLEYRCPAWCAEHDKFVVASSIPRMLGLDKMSPRVYGKSCRVPRPRLSNSYQEFILQRGLAMERVAFAIYQQLCLTPGTTIEQSPTLIHPTISWLMATPDGIVKDSHGTPIRTIEIKNPFQRHAFLDVPPEYMAQIQFAMFVSGIPECDFFSLEADDCALTSIFIVHRVHMSQAYIDAAIPYLRDFCVAVIQGIDVPVRSGFPKLGIPVVTEQVFRMENAIHSVPNGPALARQAILEARTATRQFVVPPPSEEPKRQFDDVMQVTEPTTTVNDVVAFLSAMSIH